ncbi:TPA: hypothetical protein QH056_001834 [Klebsiella oxytoca]|nr:hypothetical protein [Klebsiella oxytoca]
MANPLDNLKPLKPGEGGRKLGSKNKSTIEREKEYIQYLENKDVQYKLINKLIERIDSDEIRTSEIIKAISTVNSYLIRTIDQIETTEVIQEITSRDQAVHKVQELRDTLTLLRAVK